MIIKKIYLLLLVLSIAIVGFVLINSGFNIQNVEAQSTGTILYVGGGGAGNYSSIQAAIDNASNGDTVFVYNGTYHESVVVNKSINLIGESMYGTIIDENFGYTVGVNITADWVNISGFYVRFTNDAAIKLYNSSNDKVFNCHFGRNGYDILLWNSNNNTITNNDCHIIDFYYAASVVIMLKNSNNNTITNNDCHYNLYYGILLNYSNNNIIANNDFSSNIVGVSLLHSNNNTLTNNNCSGGDGIWVQYSNNNNITNNDCSAGGYGICIQYSNNNNITNNDCSAGIYGIWLDYSSHNALINNNCHSEDEDSIYLRFSNNNTIENNTCAWSNRTGISLRFSNNNTLIKNICNGNGHGCAISNLSCPNGISLIYSNGNTITKNYCRANARDGIYLYYSHHNTITNNNCSSRSYTCIDLNVGNNNIMANNICYGYGGGYGFWIYGNYNILINNTCLSTFDGVDVFKLKNIIYLNNFVNETLEGIAIYPSSHTTRCNSTVPITYIYNGSTYTNYLGNYYFGNLVDVYNGSDANGDGVGDTPLDQAGGVYDYYPLMKPSQNYHIINYLPLAKFSCFPLPPIMVNDMINFTDLSYDWDGYIVNHTWNFGDGNISYEQNPQHQYGDDGAYTVTLTVTDSYGATDSTSKTILVLNIPPVANFSYSPTNPTDLDTISFMDASYDTDGSVVVWYWQFGDGNSSSEQNSSHKYSDDGTYLVNLTVTDNDGTTDIVQKSIVVSNVPPVSNFEWQPSNPTDLDTIQFNDLSGDLDGSIISWHWELGDGATSTLKNPSHKYTDDGTYLVNLTVTDDDGATDTIKKSIIVSNIPPTADFSYSFENNVTLKFTDLSYDLDDSIVNYTWDFGDGNVVYSQNPVHKYPYGGRFTVTLTVVDSDGATDSISKRIYIDIFSPYTEIWVNGSMGENGWYVGKYVIIGFIAHDSSGVAYTKYRLDGKAWHDYGVAIGIWKNGKHIIEYYSIDGAGNTESIKSYSFKLDNIPPQVKVIYPDGEENLKGITKIKWNAFDNCGDSLSINIYYSNDNGTTWHVIATNEENDGSYDWNTLGLPNGSYIIKVIAKDDAGNNGEDISDASFTISNPSIPLSIATVKPKNHLYIMNREIVTLPNKTIVIGAITIEVDIKSVLSITKVEFYIDGKLKANVTSPFYQWKWNERVIGLHQIMVIVYDEIGNNASDTQDVEIVNLLKF